jgi:hypothetical protein
MVFKSIFRMKAIESIRIFYLKISLNNQKIVSKKSKNLETSQTFFQRKVHFQYINYSLVFFTNLLVMTRLLCVNFLVIFKFLIES